jgi:hypothetical protein
MTERGADTEIMTWLSEPFFKIVRVFMEESITFLNLSCSVTRHYKNLKTNGA